METIVFSLFGALVLLVSVSVYHIRKKRKEEFSKTHKTCIICKRRLDISHFDLWQNVCDSCDGFKL